MRLRDIFFSRHQSRRAKLWQSKNLAQSVTRPLHYRPYCRDESTHDSQESQTRESVVNNYHVHSAGDEHSLVHLWQRDLLLEQDVLLGFDQRWLFP
jgi:hypothetical protein